MCGGGGACMVVLWGMCGRGACMAGGRCVAGGRHAWQERWQLLRTVRILLECILVEAVAVNHYFTEKSINITWEPASFHCCRQWGSSAGWQYEGGGKNVITSCNHTNVQPKWSPRKIASDINEIAFDVSSVKGQHVVESMSETKIGRIRNPLKKTTLQNTNTYVLTLN